MRKYITTSLLALSLICTGGFASCKKEAGGSGSEQVAPFAELPKEVIDFKSDELPKTLSVKTNVDVWTAKSDQPWCKPTRSGKTLRISVDKSTDFKVRTATITLTFGNIVKTLTVRQLGSEPTILVDRPVLTVEAVGGGLDFVVTTNVDVEIKTPAWIVKPSESRSLELRKLPFSYVAEPYKGDNARTENIEVLAKVLTEGQTTPTKVLISVTQKGLSVYNASSADEIKGDNKLKIVSGSATSTQPNGESGIERSFDGDLGTIYHSKWDNAAPNYFPIELVYNLEKEESIDYLIYHPRQNGANGNFKEVEFLASVDGHTYKSIATRDFKGVGTASRVNFDKPVQAKHIKVIVKSGAGDKNNGFASCAEMEFYAKRTDAFDYKMLFKDETCSELKPGITEQEIKACKSPFFRNLAYYMLNNKYSREFRVAEFKPWANPTILSSTHKTNPYSLLDNPTGISVKEGDDLVVIVGDTHGYDRLALCVINFNKPSGDGFNDRISYPIFRGVNKIKMKRAGLVYVLYHVDKLEDVNTHKPIKIHFASGAVNGYYDNEKHKGRWNELIGKAIDPYFDVLGQYVHMTFPTNSYRSHVPDGEKLVERYDKVVHSEMTLLGLYKGNHKPFQNRMYMHVMYHSYMYATWFHTAYEVGTLPSILNMNEYALWGPAHEIGHMNQTRPGVMWKGMTECTVNIKSAYVQTTVFGQPCRLQVENMSGAHPHNRYTKAWNDIIVRNRPHSYGEQDHITTGANPREKTDVFVQLVPFWQLELYFGKVLGMTPSLKEGGKKDGFYPDLYEYYRNNASAAWGDNGHHQTEFAYVASKISGYDLTDFFTKWGFLRPVNKTVDDYGQGQLIVTEQRVNEVKNKINGISGLKSLGNIPIEYITDNTVELFRNKSEVIAGRVQANAQTLTLTGWKHVVAFEVIEKASNKVVYVGDGRATLVHGSLSQTAETAHLFLPTTIDWASGKYKVVGVSATGKRVDAQN